MCDNDNNNDDDNDNNNNNNNDDSVFPAEGLNRLQFSKLNENIIKGKKEKIYSDDDKSNIVKSGISTKMDVETIYHKFKRL